MLHPHDGILIVILGGRHPSPEWTGVQTMYRVIAIVGAGLALAGCSSSSELFSSMKPGPTLETVRLESEPPGAEAKTASGQTCRTPCALAIQQPESGNVSVTFALNGYQSAVTEIELVSQGDGSSKLQPNPVLVQLTPAAPRAISVLRS